MSSKVDSHTEGRVLRWPLRGLGIYAIALSFIPLFALIDLVRKCESDCFDYGAGGLFLLWLLATPLGFLGGLLFRRGSVAANREAYRVPRQTPMFSQAVGYLYVVLSFGPLFLAEMFLVGGLLEDPSSPFPAVLYAAGAGLWLGTSGFFLVALARGMRNDRLPSADQH